MREGSQGSARSFNTALPTKQIRVLVVDDDADIADLLQFSLSQEGYKVETANSGREGLQLLDEFSPDLMCVDYMMPEMDGQELARQIRARQDMLYVPIVMLTASTDEGSVKLSSLDSGVDAYLTKPISAKELKVTIRALLRAKTAQDKMLEALERVAEVQDELLEYERRQGQFEAMQTTIATFTQELAPPVQSALAATDRLTRSLSQPDGNQMAQLKQLQTALTQVQTVIDQLNARTEFATIEGWDDQMILDLDLDQVDH